jgi:hypothetical protein
MGGPKNSTFAFFGEKISKNFCQKSSIRGIFLRLLKIFHQKTQKYGFLAHPVVPLIVIKEKFALTAKPSHASNSLVVVDW